MRRFASDRDFRAGFTAMLPVCIGTVPFGLVCGVGAAAAGASALGALGLSAIVFSGAAQILAVQLLAAGSPLAVIVLTCFVGGTALSDLQRRDGALPAPVAAALAARAWRSC